MSVPIVGPRRKMAVHRSMDKDSKGYSNLTKLVVRCTEKHALRFVKQPSLENVRIPSFSALAKRILHLYSSKIERTYSD